MIHDNVLTLIKEQVDYETPGEAITRKESRVVYCRVKSVSRSDYWGSRTTGLELSVVFVVYSFEYEGERYALYEGELFEIIRSYNTRNEMTELVCARKKGHVNPPKGE